MLSPVPVIGRATARGARSGLALRPAAVARLLQLRGTGS